MQASYTLTNEGRIPQAIQLERVVIGSILMEPGIMDDLQALIPGPEVFRNPAHERLYRLMLGLYDAGEYIDLYTVGQRIQRDKDLSRALTPADLAGYTQLIGSGSSVVHHAIILIEKYIARELAEAGMLISSAACDDSNDVADVLSEAARKIDKIQEIAAGKTNSRHLKGILTEAMRETEARQIRANQGVSTGVPTGLRELDKLLGGWQPATLNIVAARPSMGKTALMIHFAKSASAAGIPGCIYSLEMSDVSLANRLLMSDCNVDIGRFKSGNLSSVDWDELNDSDARLSRLPIYIDDNPVVSMRYIRSRSRVMHKKGLCEWIMIDYLQLAETDQAKGGTREREIAEASRQAKIIAKELNIPVILLSQLSRAAESRNDKKPMLADLRESGAIEQDADTVTFVYRPAYYKIQTIESRSQGRIEDSRNYGQLLIAKQRDGAIGTVSFLHNDSMTKIEDYTAIRHEEMLFEKKSQNETAPF